MKDLVQIAQKSKPVPEPMKAQIYISGKREVDRLKVQIIRYEYRFRKSLAKHITIRSLATEHKVCSTTIQSIINYEYYREIPDMTTEAYHQSQKPKKKELTIGEQVKRDKKAKGNAQIEALRASIDL